jgi:hypothetical protein
MKTNWNLLRRDRLKHIGCGFLISLLTLTAMDGFIAAAIAGAAAEYKDRAYSSSWDWADLLATILGGAVGAGLRAVL